MSEKIKLSLLILFIGLLWGGYEIYDFSSVEQVRLSTELETKKNSVSELKMELDKLKNFSERIDELKGRLKKANGEYEEVLEFIPRSLDYAKLLAKLNALAQNSGVEVEIFKPKTNEEKKASSPPPQDVQEGQEQKNTPTNFFEAVEFDLRLRGGFGQTLMFLDQVSRLKRIINVETLAMAADQGEQKRFLASGVTPVETVATIKTYKFIE